ncbi:MAG: hypothetical protein K2X81_00445, partial [Candidatus Obscuribacterales bacterium]|nr:hypothetical protein [Candidatus Obscuribacterales bacterium]
KTHPADSITSPFLRIVWEKLRRERGHVWSRESLSRSEFSQQLQSYTANQALASSGPLLVGPEGDFDESRRKLIRFGSSLEVKTEELTFWLPARDVDVLSTSSSIRRWVEWYEWVRLDVCQEWEPLMPGQAEASITIGRNGQILEIEVSNVVMGKDRPSSVCDRDSQRQDFASHLSAAIRSLEQFRTLVFPDQLAVKEVRLQAWFFSSELPRSKDVAIIETRWLNKLCLFCKTDFIARTDWSQRKDSFVCHSCLSKAKGLFYPHDELLSLLQKAENIFCGPVQGICSFCSSNALLLGSASERDVAVCADCVDSLRQKNKTELCKRCNKRSVYFGERQLNELYCTVCHEKHDPVGWRLWSVVASIQISGVLPATDCGISNLVKDSLANQKVDLVLDSLLGLFDIGKSQLYPQVRWLHDVLREVLDDQVIPRKKVVFLLCAIIRILKAEENVDRRRLNDCMGNLAELLSRSNLSPEAGKLFELSVQGFNSWPPSIRKVWLKHKALLKAPWRCWTREVQSVKALKGFKPPSRDMFLVGSGILITCAQNDPILTVKTGAAIAIVVNGETIWIRALPLDKFGNWDISYNLGNNCRTDEWWQQWYYDLSQAFCNTWQTEFLGSASLLVTIGRKGQVVDVVFTKSGRGHSKGNREEQAIESMFCSELIQYFEGLSGTDCVWFPDQGTVTQVRFSASFSSERNYPN